MSSLLFFQVRETRGVNKSLREHLNTVYFAKNNKKKNKKVTVHAWVIVHLP